MIKTKTFKLTLLMGLMACLVAILCCMQTAYADVESADNVANADDEYILEDYEDYCNEWRIERTTFLAGEEEGNYSHTYHVKDNKFNCLHFDRGDKHFDIDYDYRGYHGNRSNVPGRKANVQYFYNSQTHILHLVAMTADGCDIGYDTMGYGDTYFGTDIFEDTVEYESGKEMCIANECTEIVLDTEITAVKDYSLKGFGVLEKIDILGQMYNESNLKDLGMEAFAYCGGHKLPTRVEMNFLGAHKLNADELLNKEGHWRQYTLAVYGNPVGYVCNPVALNFYSADDLAEIIGEYSTKKGVTYIVVDLYRDFDTRNKTIYVREGLTLKFTQNHYTIHNSLRSDMNDYPLFNVSGDLELYNGIIQEVDGAASTIVVDGGKIFAQGIDFVKRDAYDDRPTDGGFFYFDKVSSASSFNDCKFNGIAKNGGAIYINDIADKSNPQTFIFDKCRFNGCESESDGGAIYNDAENTNMIFNNVQFNNCASGSDGGAIASVGNNENYELNKSEINSCSAKGDGGAIYNFSNPSTYTFNDSKIYDCRCKVDGGAIASKASYETYSFNNSSIDSCSAGSTGGAIYVYGKHDSIIGTNDVKNVINGIPKLDNISKISNCKSDDGGGAIYTTKLGGYGHYLKIENISFIGNHSDEEGGAVCANAICGEVIKCKFISNSSQKGGAIYSEGMPQAEYDLKVKDCEFMSNSSTDSKGASCYLGYCHPNWVSGNKIFYQESFDQNREVFADTWEKGITFDNCFEAIHFG